MTDTRPYNGGFIKGSRTQDNILILIGCVETQLFLGKSLFGTMVDFKKAFNFVSYLVFYYSIYN